MTMNHLIMHLKELSDFFRSIGIYDIFTNSKIFELIIAEQLGHKINNGHAYTTDASDLEGHLFEYKHFKLSSSNHTWTFNDFTVRTIEKLNHINAVIFAVIDDKNIIPLVKEIYVVPAEEVSRYLQYETPFIHNIRPMINISIMQIQNNMKHQHYIITNKALSLPTQDVFNTIWKIEEKAHITGLLTSNKLWELLVADKLGHYINPEQKKHDAYDDDGLTYEYKVSIRPTWTFQDISDNVLNSYINDNKIVLAVVDKVRFCVVRPLINDF